ncbi:MAG: efflux transporter outer membrane subunit, partial [Rhodospirillales bacterium]|nr:efflux transporter outer membrane subunit [Rhodospirillales bacterium]
MSFLKRGTALAPVSLMAAALSLGGCTVGPDFSPPSWASPASWFSRKQEPPPQPKLSYAVAEPVDPNWWRLFADAQLTALEDRVAAENLDVRVAAIRFAESRAQLASVRSSLFPSLNANASYERQKPSNTGEFAAVPDALGANGAYGNTTGGISGQNISAFDVYQTGFDASWEVDLWGRVRRSVESATANQQAAEEAQRATLLSSLAEVARDYIQLRGAQEQLRIARENLHTAQQSLRLTQQRAAGGVTTDLDVANASAQLRVTAAQIPALEQQEAALINALSLLLGQPPNALRAELAVPKPIPPGPPTVPVGLPSELARRRPDIRQAEAQLHAATADIGVAVADFYPSLTLNGSVGLQSLQFAHVFDLNSRNYGLGPGLTVPLFRGGQLRAQLQLREAQQQEAAINYQKTVLQAWQDVDNALTAYRTEQERRVQLQQAVVEN